MDNDTLLLLITKIEEKLKSDEQRDYDLAIKIAKVTEETKQNSKLIWYMFTTIVGGLIAYIVSIS